MAGSGVRRSGAAVLAALAVAVASLTGPSGGAAAEVPAAVGPHTISGFAVAHGPAQDWYSLHVELYESLAPDGYAVDDVVTDSSGRYAFDVADGTYYLRFSLWSSRPAPGPGSAMQSEWYPDNPLQRTAVPVVVRGGDVRLADVELEPAPELSGRVVDEAGDPVGWTRLHFGSPDYPPDPRGEPGLLVGADGRFSTPVGGTDPFVFRIGDFYWEHAPEYYRDQYDFGDATEVRVVEDTVLPPIVVGPGGALAGRLTDDTGAPVRGAGVELVRQGWEQSEHGTVSDTTGRYRIENLAAGSYLMRLHPREHLGAPPQQVVTVRDHQTTRADAELTRVPRPTTLGRYVEGRLLDDRGRPVGNVHARAVQLESDYSGYAGEDLTDPVGRYRILLDHYTPGAEVQLVFEDTVTTENGWDYLDPGGHDYGLETAWYPGVEDPDGATRFVVPVTGLALPDTTLDELGGICGTVLLPDGSPPGWYAPQVVAVDADGDDVGFGSVHPSGRYHVQHLPAGAYRLEVRSRYHYGRTLPDPVEVVPHETVTGVDTTVDPVEITVTGRLLDPSGRPAVGVPVEPRTVPDDTLLEYGVATDSDGRFSFTAEAGRYRLRFGNLVDRRFRVQWHGGTSFETATTLTVRRGDFAPLDVGDVRVSPYPVVSGRVTDAGGARLARVQVVAFRPDGTRVPDTLALTVGDGSYRLRLPAGGSYRLGFAREGSGGPEQYAGPLTVGEEQQLAGVDAVLPGGSPPPPPPAPPPPATAGARPSSVSASSRVRRGRVLLRVAVTGGTGTVQVREAGKAVTSVATGADGTATVRIRRPGPGRHTYTVSYAGSTTALPSSTTVTVRVKRVRRAGRGGG